MRHGALFAAASAVAAAVVHKSLNADSHKDVANNVLNGENAIKDYRGVDDDVFTNS